MGTKPYPDPADPRDPRNDLDPTGTEQGDPAAPATQSPDGDQDPTAIEAFDEEGAGIAAKE